MDLVKINKTLNNGLIRTMTSLHGAGHITQPELDNWKMLTEQNTAELTERIHRDLDLKDDKEPWIKREEKRKGGTNGRQTP